jgi:hypothetical protein
MTKPVTLGRPQPGSAASNLLADLEQAETKAWDALARYKFMMFGYWAAIWVHQNWVGKFRRPNPWRDLVQIARAEMSRRRTAAEAA